MAEFGKALSRGLDIVEALARKRACGYAELQGEIDVSPASFTRFLKILVERGYVQQGAEGQYRLGKRLAELGPLALQQEPLEAVVRPHLNAIAIETKERTEFAHFEGKQFHFVASIDCPQTVVFSARPGDSFPISTSSAIGRIALAYGQSSSEGKKMSETECRKIRRANHCELIQNNGEALRSAAPAFNSKGKCIGAVVVAAPVFRAKKNAREQYRKLVIEHAAAISEELGYKKEN